LPWDLPVDGRQLPLVARGQLLGNLYVRVDRGTLRSVQAAIALLSLLLAGAVLLFARQFRRQEHVISRTTVELDEKKRELVRLERLALAGQLSANLLHDLKKPVLNIKNEAEELEGAGQEMKSPREAGEPGRRIRNQVDTFFSILRDSTFERFVRAEGEREYVGINELIERSLALVRYERGAVEVDLRLDPAVPSVLAVPVRLVQVFSNLVLNAFQAMEGRGKLTISTAGEAGRVAVVIADTGPGIHPDALDRIFTPFYTTKPSDTGTGLGLYITRDIVDDMGGSISVESSPAGTAFRIELPAEYASP
jgi:signal transduction histidine kinase